MIITSKARFSLILLEGLALQNGMSRVPSLVFVKTKYDLNDEYVVAETEKCSERSF